MNKLIIIVACALFSMSCVTKSKVYTWLDKHPLEAAKYCAVQFPTQVEYIPGETIIKRDTQYMEPDSVPCPPDAQGNVVKIPCPPLQIQYIRESRIDTVKIVDYPELAAMRLRYFEERDARVDIAVQLSVLKKKATAQTKWIIGLSLMLAVSIYLWIKNPFKLF